jgi:hypothetical protein
VNDFIYQLFKNWKKTINFYTGLGNRLGVLHIGDAINLMTPTYVPRYSKTLVSQLTLFQIREILLQKQLLPEKKCFRGNIILISFCKKNCKNIVNFGST